MPIHPKRTSREQPSPLHVTTACAFDWRTAVGTISAVGLFVALSGCGSGMSDIDEKTTRLLRESAERLSAGSTGQPDDVGGTVPPDRAYPMTEGIDDPRLRSKQPGTTNPALGSLTFKTAAESRNVSERLQSLQAQSLDQPDAMKIDLAAALSQSQKTAREFITQQEEYILTAIRLLIEEHRWSPRLFNDTSVGYSNAQADGDATENTLSIMNELGVRQQLPFGGQVAARWIWEASEDLRSSVSGQYEQSSRIVLDGNIPLLRGAGDVAQESRIQARRNLVYAARTFEDFRRTFMVSLARDYFNLLLSQDSIASQERQLDSLVQLEERQGEWYRAGKLPEFEVNLARNNVLNARASLANLREQYILSLDRFKIRLGLDVRQPVEILSFELPVPEPDVSLDEATMMALEYRLDLQNQRDQVDDTKRQVRNARNNLLPDLNLSGSLTLPTDADEREGGAVYEPDDASYSTAMTLSLPLDREIERLQLRSTIIAVQQAQRTYEQSRDNVVLDVRARVREIERARLNLDLAQERVNITLRRQEEQKIKEDEVDTQARVDTANDLLQAERARDQARTDVRNAVLDYLLATGQLRVGRDGRFQPLPGMDFTRGTNIGASGEGSAPSPVPVPAEAPEVEAAGSDKPVPRSERRPGDAPEPNRVPIDPQPSDEPRP